MPHVRFTQNIQRHVQCPDKEVPGRTLQEVLNAYFGTNDKARLCVLDERGTVRQHMAIFINGKPITDRVKLSDPVPEGGIVDVMQALSGG